MLRSFFFAVAAIIGLAALPVLAQDSGATKDNPAAKPTLTVFTYDAFAADWGPGPQLKQGFEAECGCTLDFVAADSSIGALRKVQLEGTTTKADIVLGLDTAMAGEASATGLFAKHGVDTSKLSVPTDWTSDQFVPFDYGYFAFVYNKTKVQEPPKSFQELIAKPQDFKIVVQDPRSSTPGLGLVLWIKAAYGDKAKDIWAGLAPHIVTMTPDWSSAYSLFLKGEADMVLSYTTSPAYHAVAESDDNYAAAGFKEGHYMQIEVAGILKSSSHKELAKRFLEYLISKAGQDVIPHTNWMYPVLKTGTAPAGFADLVQPDPVLLLSDQDVQANKSAWIEEALAALR